MFKLCSGKGENKDLNINTKETKDDSTSAIGEHFHEKHMYTD